MVQQHLIEVFTSLIDKDMLTKVTEMERKCDKAIVNQLDGIFKVDRLIAHIIHASI